MWHFDIDLKLLSILALRVSIANPCHAHQNSLFSWKMLFLPFLTVSADLNILTTDLNILTSPLKMFLTIFIIRTGKHI